MKRTILAPGHELLSYRIHEVTPYINWIYFFHAWGFQPRFAAIANIHGCEFLPCTLADDLSRGGTYQSFRSHAALQGSQ